jgi:hypothetical protein
MTMKNRTSRKALRGPEWAIVVRLDDGSRLYYSTRRDAAGQHDWSPFANEAQRFDSEKQAAQAAAPFEINRKAKEYEIVWLGAS